MDERDETRFTVLMNTIGEMTPGDKPSPEKTMLYFECLKDMPYDLIKKRMTNHLRFNKWFPVICEIRQEADPELQAQEDCRFIEHLCRELIFSDFPMAGREAIGERLKTEGREDLMYLVNMMGAEISNGQNPTATRAQMIKVHKARIIQDLLTGTEQKKLNPKLEKLIEPMIKK